MLFKNFLFAVDQLECYSTLETYCSVWILLCCIVNEITLYVWFAGSW